MKLLHFTLPLFLLSVVACSPSSKVEKKPDVPAPKPQQVTMVSGWEEKIEAAQKITSVTIDGKQLPRVRYGSEKDDWGADHGLCHDCGVKKGQYHVPGCDVERCPNCGGQLISCACEKR